MKKIKLTQGKYAIIDDEDYEEISKHKWLCFKNSVRKTGQTFYAARGNKRGCSPKTIFMHRVILNAPEGKIVDHKNHNGLDNRRENIKVCSHSENQFNRIKSPGFSSGSLGVHLVAGTRWRAMFKNKHIGYFDTEAEASIAYAEYKEAIITQIY